MLYLLLVVYIATILLIMGNEKRTRARKARSRAVDKKAIEEGKRRRRDGGSSSKSQEVEGTISAVLAGTMFKVKLANGHELLAHISGKCVKDSLGWWLVIRLSSRYRPMILISAYHLPAWIGYYYLQTFNWLIRFFEFFLQLVLILSTESPSLNLWPNRL